MRTSESTVPHIPASPSPSRSRTYSSRCQHPILHHLSRLSSVWHKTSIRSMQVLREPAPNKRSKNNTHWVSLCSVHRASHDFVWGDRVLYTNLGVLILITGSVSYQRSILFQQPVTTYRKYRINSKEMNTPSSFTCIHPGMSRNTCADQVTGVQSSQARI